MNKEFSTQRKIFIFIGKLLMLFATTITISLVIFITIYILFKGIPNITYSLISEKPSYIKNTIGILPDILNTLYIIILTLILELPIGICSAIYLTEYAKNKKIVNIIEFTTETLSGIPSIIYGLVGMLFFCQFLNMKTSLIAGAFTLTIMNLPIIIKTTQESLKSVPNNYREGSLGLGAGKWRTIKSVVLPCCIDGIITGCILSIGRIIGESAALLFTAGFAHSINNIFNSINKPGATLTVSLYMYSKEHGDFDTSFAIAAILMIITIILNIFIKFINKYIKKRSS